MAEEIKPEVANDLVIGVVTESATEEVIEEEGEFEYTTRTDYINAAYSAIAAVKPLEKELSSFCSEEKPETHLNTLKSYRIATAPGMKLVWMLKMSLRNVVRYLSQVACLISRP
jgi:hypothetical protein